MVLRAPAEDLPFDDGAFDTVVSTLTLCSVDDQRRAVGELRRVLRPGGGCCSSSTCAPTTSALARMQDRMNWLNRLVVCCDCNRPTLDTLRAAGFAISQVVRTELPGAPPFARPLAVGSAVSVPVRRVTVRSSVASRRRRPLRSRRRPPRCRATGGGAERAEGGVPERPFPLGPRPDVGVGSRVSGIARVRSP